MKRLNESAPLIEAVKSAWNRNHSSMMIERLKFIEGDRSCYLKNVHLLAVSMISSLMSATYQTIKHNISAITRAIVNDSLYFFF